MTFNLELAELLQQGMSKYGPKTIAQKRELVFRAVQVKVAPFPKRPVDPVIGICAYHVSKTPFIVLYDYDDTEVRAHLVIHARSDRTLVDLSKVVW
jgi:hypothetical protein